MSYKHSSATSPRSSYMDKVHMMVWTAFFRSRVKPGMTTLGILLDKQRLDIELLPHQSVIPGLTRDLKIIREWIGCRSQLELAMTITNKGTNEWN